MPAPRPGQDSVPLPFRLDTLNGVDLFEITVVELQAALARGDFTSYQLVRHCIDRIHQASNNIHTYREICSSQ